MQWEVLIIPLIALGVWILSTLFKPAEDERTKQGGSRRGSPGRAPARRPGTDLDRFLEEARRRREMEEPRRTPSPPPPRPTISRAPLSERPSRPREAPPRPAPTVRREEVLVAVPVVRASVEANLPEAVPVAPRVQTVPPPPSAPASAREARPAPIVQQVRALLNKPQSAGAAFVLREILDRPLCKRRR